MRKTKVLSAFFWGDWADETFRGVKLGDSIEEVTQKLGKAESVVKDPDGAEKHHWEYEDEQHDVQVRFVKQKCTRVVVHTRE